MQRRKKMYQVQKRDGKVVDFKISKINEELDLNLPESEEYLTLAGLVLHELQSFPHEGDIVNIDDDKITMTIKKASATKIELINIRINE